MSIRREPTYLSTDVWRALMIISKSQEVSADECANLLLESVINERYPSVLAYLNEIRKLEKDIVKTLGGKDDSNSHK